jgi:L-lactate dehydrogenase complex protein LldG
MEREAFLERVRAAVRAGPEDLLPDSGWQWEPLTEIADDRAALAARFEAELGALGGRVHRVANVPGAVSTRVVELVRATNAQRVAVTRSAQRFDVQNALGAMNVRVAENPREFADCDIGISGVICGVAETGSVLVASGEGEARMATTLPPRYIAILRAAQIVPNLRAALRVVKNLYGAAFPANLTMVTGPSRTADIELSLTIGVHGPGQVDVILVEE